MSKDKISLHIEATPTINTDNPDTPLHKEAHRKSFEVKRDEEGITEIRKEILEHYNIEKEIGRASCRERV